LIEHHVSTEMMKGSSRQASRDGRRLDFLVAAPLSCMIYAVVTKWCVWPALTTLARNSAHVALLFVHVFRMWE
jgi:hypothetical protein